jgi:hypothetical protein
MAVETLHYQEHSTMASTWQTKIIAYSDEGGGCTLEASVYCTDIKGGDTVSYTSSIIETADVFEEEWDQCRTALDEEDCLNLPYYWDAIDPLKKICPVLAKQLDLKLSEESEE